MQLTPSSVLSTVTMTFDHTTPKLRLLDVLRCNCILLDRSQVPSDLFESCRTRSVGENAVMTSRPFCDFQLVIFLLELADFAIGCVGDGFLISLEVFDFGVKVFDAFLLSFLEIFNFSVDGVADCFLVLLEFVDFDGGRIACRFLCFLDIFDFGVYLIDCLVDYLFVFLS